MWHPFIANLERQTWWIDQAAMFSIFAQLDKVRLPRSSVSFIPILSPIIMPRQTDPAEKAEFLRAHAGV
jgi:hypothetical protein